MDFDFNTNEDSPVKQLQRAWINENCSPEILPYEEHHIERIKEQLKLQVRYYSINLIYLKRTKQ